MAKNDNLKDFLTDVADAIRAKKGTTDLINPQNFGDEIRSIEDGGGDNRLADAIVKRTITEYINNEITEISAYAFYNCNKLTKCRADNVTSVGNSCFNNCKLLTSLSLPKLKKVSVMMIFGCPSLLEIELPSAIYLDAQGLRGTPNIRKISLPICTEISALAMSNNKNLTTLILGTNSVCSLDNVSALSNTPINAGTGFIYVPDDLVESYKDATNWSTFASQIKGLSELPQE